MLTDKIKKLFAYLLGKVPELKDMEPKDALLGKVVLDIHRKRTGKEYITLPLFALKQIHAIDHEGAMEVTKKRIAALAPLRDEMARKKSLTREELARYLPSVSGIKVVKEKEESYIAFEGNGRLAALQSLFKPEDDLSLEVELYHFKNQKKILRRMNRVRRMNRLEKGGHKK